MGDIPQTENSTRLIFCRESVDPGEVSQLLGLSPSRAVRVGEPLTYDSGYTRASHLGIWELELPGAFGADCVEEQITRWLMLLEPLTSAFKQLHEAGYRPYLDCKASRGSLSLCVDPEVLVRLGNLKIALSVWLYEQSAVDGV